jgi:HK97 family phage prohead protease
MPDQITKSLAAEITKSDNGDGRFIMSSADPDRMADTFDPKAYESLEGKRLIALWQHKSDQPIGYWEDIKRVGTKMVGKLSIAPTNLGKMVKALLEHDTPLGASVGFRPTEAEPNDKGGFLFKDVEWLETSIVSVPAHQQAIRIAKEFGIDIRPSDDEPPAKSGHSHGLHEETIKHAKSVILTANKVIRK